MKTYYYEKCQREISLSWACGVGVLPPAWPGLLAPMVMDQALASAGVILSRAWCSLCLSFN